MRLRLAVSGLALFLVLLAVFRAVFPPTGLFEPQVLVHEPVGIMGTECLIALRTEADGAPARLQQAAEAAEGELRRAEALFSSWISDSPLSRLNAAPAAVPQDLPQPLVALLRRAATAHQASAGAFDITCRPQVLLWREAEQIPDPAQRAQARAASSWAACSWQEDRLVKNRESLSFDLGGIAKGSGIDAAVERLQEAGVRAGLVDVGGDLRCYGGSRAAPWPVYIRDPFRPDALLAALDLDQGAVATSGNYARFRSIDGRRFSHIIDPRRCWPADAVPSVSVLAPSAEQADIWATALSVLGLEGVAQLPQTCQALLVLGDAQAFTVRYTPGLARHLREIPPDWQPIQRGSSSQP